MSNRMLRNGTITVVVPGTLGALEVRQGSG